MNNQKETIKIGILLVFVIFFAIFFGSTKGNDQLNLIETEDKGFSYPVYDSEYNGVYKNNKGTKTYIMVGKNQDDTYRIYFVRTVAGKEVSVQLDSVQMKNGVVTFTDNSDNNQKMDFKMEFRNGAINVESVQLSLSNNKIAGYYEKEKSVVLD